MLNHDRRRLNRTNNGESGSQDGLHRRNIKSTGGNSSSLLDPKGNFAKPKSGQPASAYASIQRSNSKNDFDASNAQPLNKQHSHNNPENNNNNNDNKSNFPRNSHPASFLRDQRGKYRKIEKR